MTNHWALLFLFNCWRDTLHDFIGGCSTLFEFCLSQAVKETESDVYHAFSHQSQNFAVSLDVMDKNEHLGYQLKAGNVLIQVIHVTSDKIEMEKFHKQIEWTYV